MAHDPTSIHQFRALAAMERALRDHGAADAALARTRRPLDLGQPTALGIERRTRELGGDDPFEHFNAHWLSGAYFPGVDRDTIVDVLTKGFGAAIEAASRSGKDLIPVWVRGSDDPQSHDFRVDHVETETAVVVAIITPRPATR